MLARLPDERQDWNGWLMNACSGLKALICLKSCIVYLEVGETWPVKSYVTKTTSI